MIPTTPQVPARNSVSTLMLHVGFALVPGTLAYTWLFGVGVLAQIALACITAVIAEGIILLMRRRPVIQTLSDGSALLTAVLLALAIPPIAPWWVIVIGTAFAIIFGKQLYGGLGYNPFNPAMVGYVVLLIAFPLEMTTWPAAHSLLQTIPTAWDSLAAIFYPANVVIDSLSGATPFDTLKTQIGQGMAIPDIRIHSEFGHVFGEYAGKGWEMISTGFLLGGLYLLFTGRIAWQIPVAFLLTLAVLAGIFYLIDPARYASPLLHLFGGASMLGAFFIATDPVSASTTPRGRFFYGAGIAAIVFVIRSWGGYPEGLAFAVLLMNMAAPTIDHYTHTRVFGQGKS